MERLTYTGIVYNFPKLDPAEVSWLERVQKRLAAYEDTGLEPEEIKDLVFRFEKTRAIRAALCDPTGQPIASPAHMRDLIRAERDGRLVAHGRWVDNGIPDSMLSGCSVCGFSCGAYSFNYCPNCGAKMDAEVNHE